MFVLFYGQARELVDLATIGDQEISNDQILYVVKRQGAVKYIADLNYGRFFATLDLRSRVDGHTKQRARAVVGGELQC